MHEGGKMLLVGVVVLGALGGQFDMRANAGGSAGRRNGSKPLPNFPAWAFGMDGGQYSHEFILSQVLQAGK